MKLLNCASMLGASVFVAVAAPAFAGGVVAPVIEAPVIVATPAPVSDWAGAYGGISLGYSGASDDEVGLEPFESDVSQGIFPNVGSADIKGPTVGLSAGYRWQRDRWVFGPELTVEGGSVDATTDYFTRTSVVVNGPETTETEYDGRITSSVSYIVGLQAKTGYLIDPQTVAYGTAGIIYGDFDYKIAGSEGSLKRGYSATGYSLGLGVERRLNARTSVFAEWQYRNFGKKDVDFGDRTSGEFVRTEATPEHHNIRMGLNFKF
ncbi:MAG: porin family protein [Paracoccus denitrificans]|nr:MAG: porin family protein [Paracoccus denitrificans]PZO86233.1 MAG: porin family protein [Paracoccus denitrificans]